jgi:predicted RNase H-like nuclease
VHDRAVHVIGIDWAATEEAKCGLALGDLRGDGSLEILELLTGRQAPGRRSAAQVAGWLKQYPDSLVAIDAPLGWPSNLARAVSAHVAGEPLGTMADAPKFFTRETDRFVHREFKKSPLEVGADRIARTAFSALCLVSELRDATGLPLRMAWKPAERGVLEVYPAATLKAIARGWKLPPYKKPEQADARREIVNVLADHVEATAAQLDRAVGSDHLLDAIVCALAGADFALRRAMEPPAELCDHARREGWIWVRTMAPVTSPSTA